MACELYNSLNRQCETEFHADGSKTITSKTTDVYGNTKKTVTVIGRPDNQGNSKTVTNHADGSKTTNIIQHDTNNQVVAANPVENESDNTMLWLILLVAAVLLYFGTKSSSVTGGGFMDIAVGGDKDELAAYY
jgi:hypothetical protein